MGFKIFLPAAAYFLRTYIDIEAFAFSQTASLKLFEDKSRYLLFSRNFLGYFICVIFTTDSCYHTRNISNTLYLHIDTYLRCISDVYMA